MAARSLEEWVQGKFAPLPTLGGGEAAALPPQVLLHARRVTG